jgi:hypothetical protein
MILRGRKGFLLSEMKNECGDGQVNRECGSIGFSETGFRVTVSGIIVEDFVCANSRTDRNCFDLSEYLSKNSLTDLKTTLAIMRTDAFLFSNFIRFTGRH